MSGPHVRNDFSGEAGQVFQAGGDIHYHDHRPPAPKRPVRPYHIPPSTPRFTNRSDELARLRAWLGRTGHGPPRTCVISGLPGIGTSSTARRWAESVRDAYPGGVPYVDFAELRSGADGGDVRGAQAKVLRSVAGVGERYLDLPGPELDDLYRTETSRYGSILLVLENVTQPAQVLALIPTAPGSAVVVTSNRRLDELALDGAHLMPLEPLGPGHGTELLANLCGAERVRSEPEAAARLVELCGGLPMALTVAGTRLATRRGLSLASVASELNAERGRLATLSIGSGRGRRGVAAALSVACRDLSAEPLRLYRRLGLLPGRTFPADVAAAVAGGDPLTVHEALQDLYSASLLEEEIVDGKPTGRYGMHDLVRLHARSLAEGDDGDTEAERDTALRRVVDLYVVRAAFADGAVMGDRLRITDHAVLLAGHARPFTGAGARNDALDWLEAERHNAVAAVHAAAGLGLHRQTAQLAESLTALFLNHRHPTDWVDTGTLGADAAARLGDRAMEARLRSLLSRPLMDMGLTDRARRELDAALELADATDHRVLRASVREFSARYWDRYDPPRALAQYEEALALNEAAGERRGVALVRYFTGCTQDAMGEHERAVGTLTDACDRLTGLGDARMAGRALAALGRAHGHLGRTDEAVRALERAAQTLQEQRASFYEAPVREELAEHAVRAGDPAAARRHLARAVELLQRDGSPRAAEVRERFEALNGPGTPPPPGT
ncbi:tetratricopeptide repeat protein [Streptomyces cinnamoneus]|uniref:NTPase n=1 Tax=Streptomyces cinnamoneus TaxID=53446 RepID=A0A918T9Z0_STRCJ|nr:tetratricopeptide repeat protein [Streptomyces cinnamoneus]GHC32575.1 NTPase [Streptomyces cinnamoneus]